MTQRGRGSRVEPRIVAGLDENRLTGYAALPVNHNPYMDEFQDGVLAAGALSPVPGDYAVVFDSASRAGAGTFRFRYWVDDVTPPTLRVRLAPSDPASLCWSRPSTRAPASTPTRSSSRSTASWRALTPQRRDLDLDRSLTFPARIDSALGVRLPGVQNTENVGQSSRTRACLPPRSASASRYFCRSRLRSSGASRGPAGRSE